jgi:hypothetical protein
MFREEKRMAQFKVGQRVKKVAHATEGSNVVHIGAVGTIVHTPCANGMQWAIRYDDYTAVSAFGEPAGIAGAESKWLAPLTDPRASEFIEDMERFSRVTKPTRVIAA